MPQATPQPLNILLVTGAPAELAAIIAALEINGFSVQVDDTGREISAPGRLLRSWAVLADDTLPDMSVLALVRSVRQQTDIPIVVIMPSDAEDEIVALLEAGADQCVTKPVPVRELLARVRAALRRTSGPEETPGIIDINDVRFDPAARLVSVRGREVRLTNKEFVLLHLLMANAGQILPRQLIIDRVWGPDAPDGKTLDTHIRRLRTKIEDNPRAPKHITTIRKVGYRYQRPSPRGRRPSGPETAGRGGSGVRRAPADGTPAPTAVPIAAAHPPKLLPNAVVGVAPHFRACTAIHRVITGVVHWPGERSKGRY